MKPDQNGNEGGKKIVDRQKINKDQSFSISRSALQANNLDKNQAKDIKSKFTNNIVKTYRSIIYVCDFKDLERAIILWGEKYHWFIIPVFLLAQSNEPFKWRLSPQ